METLRTNNRSLKEIDYTGIVVHAIREEMIAYFKEIDPNKVTRVRGLNVTSIQREISGHYQYVRDLERRKQPRRVHLSRIPILETWRYPDKVIFYDKVLERSPEMQELKQRLESFFRDYLPGVERKHNAKRTIL